MAKEGYQRDVRGEGDPHVMGGLIFAAKCGENCLTLLVIFSLKVTAKLQSQTWEVADNNDPDGNCHYFECLRALYIEGK